MNISNHDLLFLSGVFFDFEVAPDKLYLFKYFKTKTQRNFIAYFMIMKNHDNFVDHTGIACQDRWLKALRQRVETLETFRADARRNLNFGLLAKIESGKFKLDRQPSEEPHEDDDDDDF